MKSAEKAGATEGVQSEEGGVSTLEQARARKQFQYYFSRHLFKNFTFYDVYSEGGSESNAKIFSGQDFYMATVVPNSTPAYLSKTNFVENFLHAHFPSNSESNISSCFIDNLNIFLTYTVSIYIQ